MEPNQGELACFDMPEDLFYVNGCFACAPYASSACRVQKKASGSWNWA